MIRAFIIAFALMAFGSFVEAAAPAPPAAGSIPSRTSCTAPCGIFFDASTTTDADLPDSGANLNRAFRGLYYEWSFGDPTAGTWTYGAAAGSSKNFATGPMAAHVYETNGTYTWTLRVFDAANAAPVVRSGTITVALANDTWNQAATKCFFQTTASGDCPNGGAETQITGVGADDFDGALAGCIANTKRCLFQRGSTFTRNAAVNIGATTDLYIGAYGPAASAKPIITGTNVHWLAFNNASAANVMLVDLDVRGSDGATDTGLGINLTATVTHLTVLRLVIQEIGGPIASNIASTAAWTKSIIQDSEFKNWGGNSRNGMYLGYLVNSAVMGNSVGPIDPLATAGFPEHGIRIQWARQAVVSHNYVFGVAASKVNLTVRANTYVTSADDTQYVYVSDNKLVSNLNATALTSAPNAENIHSDIYDLIFERNWVIAQSTTLNQEALSEFTFARADIRNNIFDMASLDSSVAIKLSYGATEITAGTILSSNISIYHNTIYGGTSTASFPIGVSIEADVSAVAVMNNLMYSPSASTDADFQSGTGAAAGTQTPNSSDAEARTTDPLFASATPSAAVADFVIGATSYAKDGGTSVFPASRYDFYRCWDKTGDVRYGAFIPRANAICVGSP